MRRRALLSAAVAACSPLSALAQPGKPRRVGVLVVGQPEPFWTILRETMRELGYADADIRYEFRSAEFAIDSLDGLAAELSAMGVDAIVAVQTPAALAAKRATRTIPIVMAGVGDALATGLVSSLARPEANLTGVSTATAELAGKSVELLKEVLPAAGRMAAIANAPDPFHRPFLDQIAKAGAASGVAIRPVMIQREDELAAAFADVAGAAFDAVIVQPSLPFRLASELALRHRLPSASANRRFPAAGGLLSYAADIRQMYRDSAAYLDRILKGARPGDLPVQGPVRIELVVNLRTAQALGLEVPRSLLIRADEVIE